MARMLFALALVLVSSLPAAAKEYRADRFDVRVTVLPGGALEVTETIVFTFTEGTFKTVFRTIPTRMTDGVDFVRAAMDGRVLPQGNQPGAVHVRRRNGLRVEWHFAPVSGTTHTFELSYIARGVVRVTKEADVLAWRPLPREHDYAIGATTLDLYVPAGPLGEVLVAARRVDGEPRTTVREGVVRIEAQGIRRNGWIQPEVRFPRGSVLQQPAVWQQHQQRQSELASTWMAVAGGVLLVGGVFLVMLRQGYDAPPAEAAGEWSSMIAPEHLPPGVAGALVTNGRPRLEHAMGTLLTLADRGVVTITEQPARWGQRDFTIALRGPHHGVLDPHESTVLDLVFSKGESTVPLSKARTRLTSGGTRFKRAVLDEMKRLGLLDSARAAHRARYNSIGVALLVAGGVALVPLIPIVADYGAWPLLVPAAIAMLAIGAFALAASETPLSNEGVRRAAPWRAYQKHLGDPQGIEPRWGASGAAEARILPYAIALGVAGAWAKFMKKRGVQTPAWFHAASDVDRGPAFVAFIATGGAGAHGGSGGSGAAGVAGGGTSGAR